MDASLIEADANTPALDRLASDWSTAAWSRKPRAGPRRSISPPLDDAAFGAATAASLRSSSRPPIPPPNGRARCEGPAFFAYANNYLVDVKFGVIVDVEASRRARRSHATDHLVGAGEHEAGRRGRVLSQS